MSLPKDRKYAEYIVNKELLRRHARSNLLAFILYTKRDYIVNWHHKLICQYLDKVARREILRLMIFAPPQTGKSEILTRRFPAYLFGLNPDERIISATHTSDFAHRLNRDVQRIIDSDSYRQVFPSVSLNNSTSSIQSDTNYVRTSSFFEIVNSIGSYRSAGVGGSISGNPATFLLIDDVFSNYKSAASSLQRDRVWEWYNMDFKTRRSNEFVPVVFTITRWHEDDLAGRLLAENTEQWTVIKLPALAEEQRPDYDIRNVGEPLWSNKFNVEHYMKEKLQMGSYLFSSVYQQSPQNMSSGLFKKSNFRYYKSEGDVYVLIDGDNIKHVHKTKLTIFTTMDLAVRDTDKNDYTVIGVWGKTPQNDLILLDLYRERIEGAEHLSLLKAVHSKWHPSEHNIESVQYQLSLIQIALKSGLPARELKTRGDDKQTRALIVAAKFEAHQVFLPASASWLADYEKELCEFPYGKYKDMVDVTSYAGIRLIDLSSLAPLPILNGNGVPKIDNYLSHFSL